MARFYHFNSFFKSSQSATLPFLISSSLSLIAFMASGSFKISKVDFIDSSSWAAERIFFEPFLKRLGREWAEWRARAREPLLSKLVRWRWA